jgi:hypothetical protein
VKKLIYAIGLIFPAIATKAIAQQMKLPSLFIPESERAYQINLSQISPKEMDVLELFSTCNDHEKAIYLVKVLETSGDASTSNRMIIQRRVDAVLKLPEQQQKEQLLEMVRNGGIRWGSIGDPSDI